jgi:hypothetical protein
VLEKKPEQAGKAGGVMHFGFLPKIGFVVWRPSCVFSGMVALFGNWLLRRANGMDADA